jgi:hypothetical protein
MFKFLSVNVLLISVCINFYCVLQFLPNVRFIRGNGNVLFLKKILWEPYLTGNVPKIFHHQSVDWRRMTESISCNVQNLSRKKSWPVQAVHIANPHWKAKRHNDFFGLASNRTSMSLSFSSVGTFLFWHFFFPSTCPVERKFRENSADDGYC